MKQAVRNNDHTALRMSQQLTPMSGDLSDSDSDEHLHQLTTVKEQSSF